MLKLLSNWKFGSEKLIYLIDWSATSYDFYKGGAGVRIFLVFFDKGGGVSEKFLCLADKEHFWMTWYVNSPLLGNVTESN